MEKYQQAMIKRNSETLLYMTWQILVDVEYSADIRTRMRKGLIWSYSFLIVLNL